MRSNAFVTAGSRAAPASVKVTPWVRRSSSGVPSNSSKLMTWRLSALWDTCKALAPTVKLKFRPTAS